MELRDYGRAIWRGWIVTVTLSVVGAVVGIIAGIADPAGLPSPSLVRNTLVWLVIGLVVGSFVAIVWDLVRRRVRVARDVERSVGLPVIGELPKSEAVEPIRFLRVNITALLERRDGRSLALLAPRGTTGNLAPDLVGALAAIGVKATVLDVDSLLTLASTAGVLTDPIGAEATATAVAAATPSGSITLLTGGGILETADATSIARMADAVAILVVAGRTSQRELAAATERLSLAGASADGVIISSMPIAGPDAVDR